jgi:uncharacterized protein (DUF3084 family)
MEVAHGLMTAVIVLFSIAVVTAYHWYEEAKELDRVRNERNFLREELGFCKDRRNENWNRFASANRELLSLKQLIADLNRKANPEDDEEKE